MTREQQIELMQNAERWPLYVVLPLAHRTRELESGLSLLGFLAYGHGAIVYLGNVGDFLPGETMAHDTFEAALKRFTSLRFVSWEALVDDGWEVN